MARRLRTPRAPVHPLDVFETDEVHERGSFDPEAQTAAELGDEDIVEDEEISEDAAFRSDEDSDAVPVSRTRRGAKADAEGAYGDSAEEEEGVLWPNLDALDADGQSPSVPAEQQRALPDDEEESAGSAAELDAATTQRVLRALHGAVSARPPWPALSGQIMASATGAAAAVSAVELLAPLAADVNLAGLRRQARGLARAQVQQQVVPPLPAPQMAAEIRTQAYGAAKRNLSRWQPLVEANRSAPQLQFPPADVRRVPGSSAAELAAKFVPAAGLERDVAALLHAAGLGAGAHAHDSLPEGEPSAALTQLQARQAQLAKMRSTLFFQEAKWKRQAKIKSKAFRKMHKRDRDRAAALAAEANPEAAEEAALEAERSRIRERMELRHRHTGSAWARRLQQSGQARNPHARAALDEQNRVSQLLRRKMLSATDEDENSHREAGAQAPDRELDGAIQGELPSLQVPSVQTSAKGLMAMKFMQRGIAVPDKDRDDFDILLPNARASQNSDDEHEAKRQRCQVGPLATEPVQVGVGRFRFNPPPKALAKPASFHDEPLAVAPSESKGTIRVSRPVTVPEKAARGNKKRQAPQSSDNESNPWLSSTASTTESKTNEVLLSTTVKAPTAVAKRFSLVDGKKASDREEQEALIARAFPAEHLEKQFAEEKDRERDEAQPKQKSNFLPGWGSWSGTGIDDSKKRQKHELHQPKVTAAARKDDKLKNVIISDRRDKKAAQYLAPAVPFPFTSREEYERSLRQPLGKEWNTAHAHTQLTLPKIVITPGEIIEPMKFSKKKAQQIQKQKRMDQQKRPKNVA